LRAVINLERLKRDVIVIGASAGGVQPLKDLLALLPPNLSATVALVLHRSPYYETQLPLVLGRHSLLSVLEPADRDPVLSGAVYVAPRDQHMIFDDGCVRLSRGPREHHTRPASIRCFARPRSTMGRVSSACCCQGWVLTARPA